MTNIEMIKELRTLTSAGMTDCKSALIEASWNIQKAIDIVKIKGQNIADARSGREATEGRIALLIEDGVGYMADVNCQTDFVAKNPDFIEFANSVCDEMQENHLQGFLFDLSGIEMARKEIVGKLKENIVVRRWNMEKAPYVFGYLHSNNKIGVLVSLSITTETTTAEQLKVLGEDIAMQICALNPLAVSEDQIPADEIERQKSIFEEQLKEAGKSGPMVDKILAGKMRKWVSEVCLLDQESITSPKSSVRQVMKSISPDIKIESFTRFQVGEGMKTSVSDLEGDVLELIEKTQTTTTTEIGAGPIPEDYKLRSPEDHKLRSSEIMALILLVGIVVYLFLNR